jgi:hypothetical protein
MAVIVVVVVVVVVGLPGHSGELQHSILSHHN